MDIQLNFTFILIFRHMVLTQLKNSALLLITTTVSLKQIKKRSVYRLFFQFDLYSHITNLKMAAIYWKSACVALLLSGALQTNAQVDSTLYHKVVSLVESTREQMAPDKRLAVIEFTTSDITKNNYILQTSDKSIKDTLINRFASISANIQIDVFPTNEVSDRPYGIVNLSVANLRTKPAHSAEMATQVLLGAQVDILDKDGGDFRVRTPEGYIAWVPTSSVVPMTESELVSWKKGTNIIYTADFGKSYSEPNEKSQRVSDLVYGDVLSLITEQGSYYKVSYPDKRVAFIRKDEAVLFHDWLNSREPTSENVISSAKSMLGLPYLWGGTSVKGVDCSGLTKTSFFMNGYIIPRDASQQVLHGEKIDILDEQGNFDPTKALKNLKPADLLFFAGGKHKSQNARVTHVALYIGNGVFIHSAGTVRINSMLKDAENYDDFQTRTVVAARRYLGSEDPAIQKISENNYYTHN